MIWLLTIPVIAWFTFTNLIGSGFPSLSPEDPRGFLAWCFLIFAGCAITGIISLAPIGVAVWVGQLPPIEGVTDRDYPLVALRQQDGGAGQFFLGSGFVSDRQYYFWYRQDGTAISGGKTVREEGVRLHASAAAPFMRTFKSSYRWKWATDWWWIVGIDAREPDRWCPNFYIPDGSVKEGYSL